MKFLIVVTFVSIVSVQAIPIGDNRTVRPENEAASTKLNLVAAVETKVYFADHSIKRNWHEAKSFCKSVGLNLATITSYAQFAALKGALSRDFDQEYWTSGRDALLLRQFSWDLTNKDLFYEYVVYRPDMSQTFLTGLVLASRGEESYLFSRSIEEQTGTLCETAD